MPLNPLKTTLEEVLEAVLGVLEVVLEVLEVVLMFHCSFGRPQCTGQWFWELFKEDLGEFRSNFVS